MKRLRTVVLAAILAFSKPIKAQVFRVGPQMGGTWSTITNDSAKTVGAYSPGISYVLNMSEHVVLEGGVNYSRKGGLWHRVYEDVHQFTYATKLQYAEAPLLVSWFFNDDKKRFRPSVGAGVTAAYLVKGERLQQYTHLLDGYTSEVREWDKTKAWKRWDLGATGMAGVNYRMRNRSWITAKAGYTVGQLPVYLSGGLKKVTNRTFFAGASWQIPIGEYRERGYLFR